MKVSKKDTDLIWDIDVEEKHVKDECKPIFDEVLKNINIQAKELSKKYKTDGINNGGICCFIKLLEVAIAEELIESLKKEKSRTTSRIKEACL